MELSFLFSVTKIHLFISFVFTQIYSLSVPGNVELDGFQIDLLIDRKDDCINLCEIKFHSGPFTITKEEYQQLLSKRQRFIDFTGTKKQVFMTLITNYGITSNAYAREVVDAEIRLDQLITG